MNYTYQPTLWEPEPDDYETTPEGWALCQQQQGEVMQQLRLLYPELAAWGDLARMNAWGGFCYDDNFTSWTEPYRVERFLTYLRLAQEDKLPDYDHNREAIFELLNKMEPHEGGDYASDN